jgi:hypothetical protein
MDFFEIDRLIEDLAKIHSTACAVTWFKVSKNRRPTQEEFRVKVAEFMNHFEYTLSKFPENDAADQFRDYANKKLQIEIKSVLRGDNKEVEKRYRYFADYG